MKYLLNSRLLLIFTLVGLISACGGGGGSSDRGDSAGLETTTFASDPTVVSGVAATGAALDGATVEIIDASGNLVDVGDVLTGSDGSYQVELPDDIALPVIVRVTPLVGPPLLNIVAPPEDGSTAITANVNPVTDLVSSSALGDANSSDAGALAGALSSVDTSTLEATGDEVLQRVLGSSVQYSSFANDPNFVAKTEASDTIPSATDAILDTLAKQAEDSGTDIKTQLKNLEEQETPSKLLEEPAFQVGLIGEMIKGGTASEDLEAQLQDIGAIDEPVEGVGDVFRAVIAAVPALIQTVTDDSTALADDADLLEIATDAAVDMLADTIDEKKTRFAADADDLVSAINSPSLQDAVTKVVQSSVVPTLAAFAGGDATDDTLQGLQDLAGQVTTAAATVASSFEFTETSTDVSSLISEFVSTNVAPSSEVTAQDLADASASGESIVVDVGDVNDIRGSLEEFATENVDLIEGTIDDLIQTVPSGIWDEAVWDSFNWG
jgi:hypothetical protein